MNHLHRCKTSFGCSCFFYIMFAGGTWSMDRSGANEDTYPLLVISRLITVTYLPIFHFRQWRPAKPSTGMSFGFQLLLWIMMHLNLPQNFGVNRFQSTVRFSQSEFLSISSDGTVAFSKDKERILLHWFSCLVIQLSPVRF